MGSKRFVRFDLVSFHFYRSWIGLWRVFEVNREGNKRFDVCYCIWKWEGGGRAFGRRYFWVCKIYVFYGYVVN